MKNEKIIAGMTEKQKLSILTDSAALSAPWLDTLGVPKISVADYNSTVKDIAAMPSLDVIASSFDFSLVRDVGKRVGETAAKKGANFMVSPDISVDLSAEGNGFSEDPYLCGLLGAAMLSGFKGAGHSAATADLAIRETDFDYTDVNVDDCVMRDFFLKPLEFASMSPDCDAVVSMDAETADDGETARLKNLFSKDVNAVVPRLVYNASADGTVASVNGGATLCLNGSAVALSAALDNYRKMRQGVDDGSVTLGELEKAVESGAAISEKAINDAVDNVISFMFACYKKRHPAEDKTRPDLLEYAYIRTAVMLRNMAALPIAKGQRVATVGPLPKNCEFVSKFGELCASAGVTYLGHADGYDFDAELGGVLMPDALNLAQTADVTVVFLDEPAGHTALSANRIEILSKINGTKGKTVAVCLNRALDLDIDGVCDAIMLATLNGRESESALSRLLLGYASPTGKLAKTVYRDRTAYYGDIIKKDRASDKIGRFLGYRLYDTAGIEECYPFGHGLSYSPIKYSAISMRGNELSFTLENKGKFFVTETAEIFIGKKSSALAVPKKELKCVVNRDLRPGERARVVVMLDDFTRSLGAFDVQDGRTELENGEYILYVGRSLFDIRLQTSFSLFGKNMAREARQTPSALRVATNIHSGAYKLSDNRSAPSKNPVLVIFILMTVVTAIADAALPLIMYYVPDMALLSYILLGAINGLWTVVLVIFIVVCTKRRNRAKLRAERATFDEEQWDLESLSDVLPLTELFADRDDSGEKRVRAKKSGLQDDYDRAQYIDQSVTFDMLIKRYVKHLSTFGVGITTQCAKSVLAALASSRLIVLRNEDRNILRTFVSATSRFFGTAEYYADARQFRVPYDVFAEYNGIKNAVAFAGREPHKTVFVSLDGVDMRNIRTYFTPMIAAFANLTQSFTVDIKNSMGENVSYVIPPNMWFFMSEQSPLGTMLPSFVTDFGTVVELKLSSVPVTGKAATTDGIAYEQFAWMTDSCRNMLDFDESYWKKIDKLEDHVALELGDYSIGNKKWGRLERFISVYCACGAESDDRTDDMREALDSAVAVNLIHGMAAAVAGKHKEGNPSLVEAAERVLGDFGAETANALKVYDAEGVSR